MFVQIMSRHETGASSALGEEISRMSNKVFQSIACSIHLYNLIIKL